MFASSVREGARGAAPAPSERAETETRERAQLRFVLQCRKPHAMMDEALCDAYSMNRARYAYGYGETHR